MKAKEENIEELQQIEPNNDTVPLIENRKIIDSSRVHSLDTMRGYCVLMMIAWHYYFFLKVDFMETNFFIFWIMNVIVLPGNPMFIIVMGASLVLSLERRKQKGNGSRDNFIHLIKRAVLFFVVHHIMVISYLLYFGPVVFQIRGLYPGWIPALGINAIFSFLLLNLRKIYRFFVMLGIEIVETLHLLPYIGVDLGSLFYMIFGTILGELIIEARKNNNVRDFQKKMFITGIILFILGIPCEIYNSYIYDFFVPNVGILDDPLFAIYAIGIFILTFSILFRIQDYNKNKKRISQPLTLFSSLSLTIFYFHYALGTNFFMPFGFGNLFSLYSYVLFLVGFYITLYLFGVIWSRSKNKYSLEWIVRKFS
ncbi:MAG: heparan-alpha-glucosaminide N-acetyltransferase domain-containing protein [Candidatus Hodarchaeota archaeon]